MSLVHIAKKYLFPSPKKVLFYRDYQGLTGGHLKVWHYFQHVNSSKNYQAEIYFTPNSTWEDNPWKEIKQQCLSEWNPQQTDILFMEGMDWQAIPPEVANTLQVPVINLIQGFRHTHPDNPRYAFLKYRATRIAVSHEVTSALANIHLVNGPIFSNPNGLDFTSLPTALPQAHKDIDILVVGSKEPDFATQLAHRISMVFSNLNIIKSLTSPIPRHDFLSYINRSKVAVFFPTFEDKEGFYLPALEAMQLGTLVICPDCIGNRSFCLPAFNCFRPEYSIDSIIENLSSALRLSSNERQYLLNNAKLTASEYTLERERKNFLQILRSVT